MVGRHGIEPWMPEPQSSVLPLHYHPHIEQEPRKPARPYPTPRTRLVSFSVGTFGTFTDIHGFYGTRSWLRSKHKLCMRHLCVPSTSGILRGKNTEQSASFT